MLDGGAGDMVVLMNHRTGEWVELRRRNVHGEVGLYLDIGTDHAEHDAAALQAMLHPMDGVLPPLVSRIERQRETKGYVKRMETAIWPDEPSLVRVRIEIDPYVRPAAESFAPWAAA